MSCIVIVIIIIIHYYILTSNFPNLEKKRGEHRWTNPISFETVMNLAA